MTTALLYIRNLKPSYLPFYEERKALGEENSIIDFGFHFGISNVDDASNVRRYAVRKRWSHSLKHRPLGCRR